MFQGHTTPADITHVQSQIAIPALIAQIKGEPEIDGLIAWFRCDIVQDKRLREPSLPTRLILVVTTERAQPDHGRMGNRSCPILARFRALRSEQPFSLEIPCSRALFNSRRRPRCAERAFAFKLAFLHSTRLLGGFLGSTSSG